MSEQARPARPHVRLTEDGRRVREVLSYSRRGARLTEREQDAWDRLSRSWVVPDDAVDQPGFDLWSWYDRDAPLVVEIGSGVGEALVGLAGARPEVNVLAFEVWRPGVAGALWRLEEAGVGNVRLIGVDAVWSLAHLFAPGSVEEVWTFFPDPWPKTRHHKRRLVQPAFARSVATALRPGGSWRLATDWASYAEQMREVLDAEPLLEGGVVPRWEARPLTRFERRGVEAGRGIVDLSYRRTTAGGSGKL
ncbi:tRNA (guanine-N(7)-)-methyltransferase [Marmoricola endophyticus]|uniref:tRNA (guanine-N(7)-)-methyltransferase n=1 Tax=Marmoricola endophyticus TaxID=2040280 RepID=A0A917BGA0_9ACTN|nr:tRNA (guanosine(46)-N7)-methyltransferase TrmB [Marmoricola endophyticus]GGF43140.1 tRNA (guanine-N(7)-)-methyltransferase [Marmoricola endophyticus]